MAREIRFIDRSLTSGLYQIFCSSPFFAICSFSCIIFISSVIPLAFIWLIQCIFLNISSISIESSFLRTAITIWSLAEVTFFFYQWYLYSKIQHRTTPPHITSAERDELVSYALANIKSVSHTLSKWFMDCPFRDIDRESIVGWLAFAFYSKEYGELNDDEYKQIDAFIEKIQEQYQLEAPIDKSDKKIFYMKHILDPVRIIFRPLAFYFVTDTLLNGILGTSIFYLRGYEFAKIGHLQFWTCYHKSSHREEEDEEPIIFFHGIGSGLLMYQPFISRIHERFSRNRRLIFISMRCISMRYPSLNDIPNMLETTDSMKMIFNYYKLSKAIFIGHSYGTACLSWIVQKCPQYISRLIFIDPICFALFEPYVIYNFVYRTPYKLGHLYMYYFVCRELGISHVVSRHFWWTQNNLYIEQIPLCSNKRVPTHIILAGRDCIVNAGLVRDYLADNNIDYYWAPNISHGGFMRDRDSWEKVCEWIS
ncbi:unnamed protein product [Rotaria socialis]|uniref:AB hydrolase-1 domain-containing protein n=1 Tax=Rotaria socialis TaxID=392032 RepID=A0A817RNW5_9BILA|nr:unnamed protein product [Rotaria socialis]CAF3383587.1 unnamed protein product [Rotaria socialis]CAF3449979.1 unnamed protein product [Rotaria socialis]CAF3451634.1 unnamed protein product [Rotaria socialis]CAF4110440.1 unnamed protein product [Rotaria socialis]